MKCLSLYPSVSLSSTCVPFFLSFSRIHLVCLEGPSMTRTRVFFFPFFACIHPTPAYIRRPIHSYTYFRTTVWSVYGRKSPVRFLRVSSSRTSNQDESRSFSFFVSLLSFPREDVDQTLRVPSFVVMCWEFTKISTVKRRSTRVESMLFNRR